MTLCASCGLQLFGETPLCPHHHMIYGDEWAAWNRAICNLIHRGIEPPPAPPGTEDKPSWIYSDLAAWA